MTNGVSTVVGRSPAVHKLLGIGWTILIAVTAVGHVTALRNSLTVVVSLFTLAVFLRDWRTLPCKRAMAALTAWAILSLSWSVAPDISFGKLRTDLIMPILAAAGAYLYTRDGAGWVFMVRGLVLGLVALATLSAFAYLPPGMVPASWPLEQAGGIVRPLPHWYPGPGDASMFAILAIAPLVLAFRRGAGGRSQRGWASLGGAALLFVLVTTNNRNAVVVAPLVLGVQWLLDRRATRASRGSAMVPSTGSPRSIRRASLLLVGGVLALLLVLAAVLEFGARERLAYLHKPLIGDSAAIELAASDTRPAIWRYYFERGLRHPWRGLGFGRTVPGIGLQTESDRALASIEPNAYIHAHDIVLNWWLQLGLIGVVLLIALLMTVVHFAKTQVDRAGQSLSSRAVFHALLAVLLATLARNLTDDFIVYGMAIAFGIVVGGLLGDLEGRANGPP